MQTKQETNRCTVYRSEVLHSIRTTEPRLARVIAWADAHPFAWQIVCGRRSKAFGLGSCTYIGWAQMSHAPEAVLERARHLHAFASGKEDHLPDTIWCWRARFTLEHFRDREFTGGLFQQHDANYPRGCLALDYTPGTFPEVLDQFRQWMDCHYDTARITVDGTTVEVTNDARTAP